MEKYKYNYANGLWLTEILTPVMAACGLLTGNDATAAGFIIGLGSIAAFAIALLFNVWQYFRVPGHGFGNNEGREAMATGAAALFVGGPFSYLLYAWLGLTYWQIPIGLLIGGITMFLRKKE